MIPYRTVVVGTILQRKRRPVMTTTGFGASFFAEDVPSSGGAVITKKVAVTKIKVSCNHREFVGSFSIG